MGHVTEGLEKVRALYKKTDECKKFMAFVESQPPAGGNDGSANMAQS